MRTHAHGGFAARKTTVAVRLTDDEEHALLVGARMGGFSSLSEYVRHLLRGCMALDAPGTQAVPRQDGRSKKMFDKR